jgi:hypothetical protein
MNFLRLGSAVLRSALSAGGKRGTGALRVLGGRSSLLRSPAALQLATGLAFGLFDQYMRRRGASDGPQALTHEGVRTLPASATELSGSHASSAPPARLPPPLPTHARAPASSAASAGSASALEESGWRALRVALAAARADGELSAAERAALLAEARAAGAEAALEQELARVPGPAELGDARLPLTDRHALYALAYAVMRADERIDPRERTWLTEFARTLALPAETCTALEREVAARIDAAARAPAESVPNEETH